MSKNTKKELPAILIAKYKKELSTWNWKFKKILLIAAWIIRVLFWWMTQTQKGSTCLFAILLNGKNTQNSLTVFADRKFCGRSKHIK